MAAESAPAANGDRSVTSARSVDLVVSLLLLALASLLGWDAWRVGMSWADDGPQAGYFPFYLAVLLSAASLFGFVRALISKAAAQEAFVTREQFRRVMQVFTPTLLYVVLTQYLGLYVASFILVAGFMWWIGSIALWKSIVVSFLFSAAMFVTFEIFFNVIMPKGPLEAAFGF